MKLFGFWGKKKEQRSITVGPSDSLGLPYGGLSTSLSAEASMKLSAVYRCVDVKSSDIAAMPWDIFVYKGGKEWIKDDGHFSYSILNVQPNPSCSAFTFKKALVSQVELNGNGYAWIHRDDRANPVSLELLTGNVTMYIREDLSVYYIYQDSFTSKQSYIDGEDMIHILNFSYDGLLGVSTLTHAGNITSLSASADGQAKGYYQSGVNMNGIISVPNKISADNAKALKQSWKEAVSYNSTTGVGGGVVVMEGGAVYTPIQINPKDAQMLETRQFNVVDICRFFGVHPSKAFDVSSASYASAESYQLAYITDTMTPLAAKINNEFNRKLYRPSQRDRTRCELRVRALRSADLDTLGNYYSQMFQVGAYSPDDICREMNLPLAPEGKGNKRYVQVNLAPLGEEVKAFQNKNAGAGKEGNTNGTNVSDDE